MNRNPTQMEVADIVKEVGQLKQAVERDARRIYELSKVLHDRMRRAELTDDTRPIYIAFSNTWTRFAGMVTQGLNRTASADRLLKLLPTPESIAEAEWIEKQQQGRKARKQQKEERVAAAGPTSMDDLLKMYATEPEVDDAGR